MKVVSSKQIQKYSLLCFCDMTFLDFIYDSYSGITLWEQNVYETIDHLYKSISVDAILLSMSKF